MKDKIVEILKKHHLNHYGDFDKAIEEIEDLFQKNRDEIKTLPITNISINYWENKKYKPFTLKMIELDKVLNILV